MKHFLTALLMTMSCSTSVYSAEPVSREALSSIKQLSEQAVETLQQIVTIMENKIKTAPTTNKGKQNVCRFF